MYNSLKIFFIFIIIQQISSQSSQKCCSSYDETNTLCLTCPNGTYLSGNNCIVNIQGCLQYTDCYSCNECQPTYKLTNITINNQKVQSCSIITSYTKDPSDLSTQQISSQIAQTVQIVDDYIRSSHSQLHYANLLNSSYKKYNNGTQKIVIQYQLSQNIGGYKYIRATMIVDFNTLLFKQIQYKVILKDEVGKYNQQQGGSSLQSINNTSNITPINSITNTTNNTNPTNNNTNNNSSTNTSPIFPQNVNTTNNTNPTTNPPASKPINPKIFTLAQGYTQLKQNQLNTDFNYLKVQNFLKSLNPQIYNTSRFIAAFTRNTRFQVYYKIYLQTDQSTYQTYLAFDKLRNRIYLVRFNPIVL